jgi:hypothetical protein
VKKKAKIKKAIIRDFWWTVSIIYIVLTYASLGVMPAIWNSINAILGGQAIILLYVLYSAAGISILLYLFVVKRETSLETYAYLVIAIGIYIILLDFEVNPGEKIHIGQYGLLGIFLYNALRIDHRRYDIRLYYLGSLICFITGALDEVTQWLLPKRTFTLHDVFINGMSGVVTLLVIRLVILKKPRRRRYHERRRNVEHLPY